MSDSPKPLSDTHEQPLQSRLLAAATSTAALIDRAQLAERQGRTQEARQLYEQALGQLRSPEEAPIAASLLRWIGITHGVELNLDAAFDCLEAALAVAEALGDEAAVGHAVNVQGLLNYKMGRLDEAERLYLKARESARRAGEAKLAAMTSQNLGVIANIRGELEQALWHYEASLADYRALGLAKYICITLNNLGMLYTRMERWETAERAYEEAIPLSQQIGDVGVRVILEVNFAILWISRKEFAKARQACDRALAIAEETQHTEAIGEVQKCYGVIFRETGDFGAAEEAFRNAVDLADSRQDLLLSAEIARELAELYRLQGRNRDTLQSLNRAHRLFTQLHARPDLADIDRQTTRLESDFLDVVRRWGESIESKDHYTQGHCERVADLACALAAEAGLDQKSLFWFRIGALLHDVGKLMIPPEILNKPGRLTAEEWVMIKKHPVWGVEMLADIDFPWDVRPIVESHHERWDGAGYPHGLKGEEIPRTARILCIADVYDALTSERSYKKPVSHDQALDMMRSDVGHQFDPELFPQFETIMERLGPPRRGLADPTTPAEHVHAASPSEVPGEVDDLTGVLVRRAFLDAANTTLLRRRTNDPASALLVIDVDHFKLVNDTYGHLQGDDVLKAVVALLKRGVRGGDVIGRYAGDEFVVLLPRTTMDTAREVADRLRTAVERERISLRGTPSETVGVTLSIGVATAEHADHVEAVFAAADRALYEAKRAGRNAVALAGTATESSQPQLNLNRFVGRVEELKRLVRMLDTSFRGEPRVVAVVGEAGVGKSTLLRQLLPEVRLRGGSLVMGRALEADVKPPYGPWAEILSSIKQRVNAPGRVWRELPRLVPALSDGSEPRPESTGSKYALYEEIVEYVRLAAATCPLVLVLDDMQWADSATWDTLEHLVPQLDQDHIFICLTIRAEDKSKDVMDRRRRLSRDERFSEISLQRLTRAELEQWLTAASRGQELGRELLPVLYRHTEGNPFLVVQVLRALVEEGEIRYEGERWIWKQTSELRLPVAVSDLMARRLDRLSERTRNILTTAAVIGRVFDIDLALAAGAGTEDELLDVIDEAVAAAVLEPSRGDADSYAFTHTLLLDAIKETANPRRLKRIHHAVGEALEKRSSNAIAELADHFDQAGVSDKAYRYAMQAGESATTVYAHDEAAAFFTMAQRHPATPSERLNAFMGAVKVAEVSGRYAEAVELCKTALSSVQDDVTPAEKLPLLILYERVQAFLGKPLTQTLEVYQSLLKQAEEMGMQKERVSLLTMLSTTYGSLGDPATAQRLARESADMAERIGERLLHAHALMRVGWTLFEAGSEEAIVHYRRAQEICSEMDDRHGYVRCQITIGVSYSKVGNMAAAIEAFRSAVELGLQAGAPDWAGVAALNLGVLFMWSGRFDEARQRFDEARKLFIKLKNELHRVATIYNMGHLARESGDPTRALELYEEAATSARRLGQLDMEIGALAGAGLAGLDLNRRDYAYTAARNAETMVGERFDWWFQNRELVEALSVRVTLELGRRDEAEQRFRTALADTEPRDARCAAWLAAECAPALIAAGADVWDFVRRFSQRADDLGYTALATRFRSLLARHGRSSGGRHAMGA
ncbi:MAG TPA: tetratricopeptide repeat protein [Gemmatimonadaceae bacterium]|jgi:diguanylate cyclase (GGDEF)-like protein/putative nucleotidyltransferase with HDIG domain